jgi:effector-binding domain-containing protein
MKILKTIGLVLAGLLFLIVLVSLFLPSTYHVERSVVINKKADVPFGIVRDFKAWDLWSPWHELDSTMPKTYSETMGEVGSWYQWDSKNPNVGKGKITITAIKENESIENELAFDGMGTSIAAYTFAPEGEGTKVTWSLEGNCSGLPWYMIVPCKYFNLMMDKMVGADFEKGLNKLKTLCESMPEQETITGFAIEERQMPALVISGIRSKVKTTEMSSALFAKWFALLSQELSHQNLQPTGAPMTIYHAYGPKEVEVEAAIPVQTAGNNAGPVVFWNMPSTKALVVKYYGDYNNVESVYAATYTYLKGKGQSSSGAPMEIYITDPGIEKDTAKWLTEIVFPLDSI